MWGALGVRLGGVSGRCMCVAHPEVRAFRPACGPTATLTHHIAAARPADQTQPLCTTITCAPRDNNVLQQPNHNSTRPTLSFCSVCFFFVILLFLLLLFIFASKQPDPEGEDGDLHVCGRMVDGLLMHT